MTNKDNLDHTKILAKLATFRETPSIFFKEIGAEFNPFQTYLIDQFLQKDKLEYGQELGREKAGLDFITLVFFNFLTNPNSTSLVYCQSVADEHLFRRILVNLILDLVENHPDICRMITSNNGAFRAPKLDKREIKFIRNIDARIYGMGSNTLYACYCKDRKLNPMEHNILLSLAVHDDDKIIIFNNDVSKK